MPQKPALPQNYWLWVLCLVGLDYFSSLAYQPSMAFEAAGLAAPIATIVLVLVTLGGALPVYWYVAHRSPNGQGATGLLERALHGWRGKLIVLTLLGFAAADFVITKTLSVADAAEHLIHNPLPAWQFALAVLGRPQEAMVQALPGSLKERLLSSWSPRLIVAILLSIIGFAFWAAFRRGLTRRVIQIAVVVVGVYLSLTAVIIGSGLFHLYLHPELVNSWWTATTQHHSGAKLISQCLFAFPRMSLGLSGFELSMVVLPLIRGEATDESGYPAGRVRNARKLIVVAAVIMSIYLLGSALVTTILIPSRALAATGPAANRALAYLAHGGPLTTGAADGVNPLFGNAFGTLYDMSTVVILSLAGASVTMGLRGLVPQYLHRLGMELEWAHRHGAILHVFNMVNLVVTVLFRASVAAQRGAYATSMLMLMASAAGAAALDRWQRRTGAWPLRLPWGFVAVSLFLLTSTIAAIVWDPDGLWIAGCFIIAIMVSSIVSRFIRTTELRCEGFQFKDAKSQFLWQSLVFLEFPILVPHRPGRRSLLHKEPHIRERHRLGQEVPIVFVEVDVGDASDFCQKPMVEVMEEEGRFVIRVQGGVSVAHVIAAVALELSKVGKPPEVHFGWSDESPVSANLNFLLFGQGNVPWMVREIICRSEANPERRPRVVIG
jgi:hypothetical protein